MSLQQPLQDYLDHCVAFRALSVHTTLAYRRDLQSIASALQALGIADWPKANAKHFRRIMAAAHSKGLAPRSLARRLSSLRQFYEFGRRKWRWDTAAIDGLKAPKSGRLLPKALDVDQINVLLNQSAVSTLDYRDLAIYELIYSSGLRLSECLDLDWQDINQDDATVIVTGKGNKQRIIPVGSKALAALARWRPHWQAMAGMKSNAVFVGQTGARLGARSVQRRLKAWGEQHGVANLHPHMLRHSFASHILQSSGQLRAVQELLGHADLSTTQIYTHLDYQHLAEAYDKAHPLAKS